MIGTTIITIPAGILLLLILVVIILAVSFMEKKGGIICISILCLIMYAKITIHAIPKSKLNKTTTFVIKIGDNKNVK